MGTKQKSKGITVMLDAEITEAVSELRQKIIRQMNDSGIFGSVAAPTMGYVVRTALRQKFGLQENAEDNARKL